MVYLKNTQYYISSDGFPDQFGGPKNKKYMVGKFKKFLIQLGEIEFDNQSEILATEFDSWKGSVHQTDDVLVIGIKL